MVECVFIMRYLFYQNYLTTPSSRSREKTPDAGRGKVLFWVVGSEVHREGIAEFMVIKAPASVPFMVVATKLKSQLEPTAALCPFVEVR